MVFRTPHVAAIIERRGRRQFVAAVLGYEIVARHVEELERESHVRLIVFLGVGVDVDAIGPVLAADENVLIEALFSDILGDDPQISDALFYLIISGGAVCVGRLALRLDPPDACGEHLRGLVGSAAAGGADLDLCFVLSRVVDDLQVMLARLVGRQRRPVPANAERVVAPLIFVAAVAVREPCVGLGVLPRERLPVDAAVESLVRLAYDALVGRAG